MQPPDQNQPVADRDYPANDPYAATAGAYDLFNAAYRPAQLGAMTSLLPRLKPENGPVIDVGAGSGLNSAWILTHEPRAEVLAIEPSPAMRALIFGRIADHQHWLPRITVRPEDFFAAPLPDRVGGAIALGVLGHFNPTERVAFFSEIASRLAPDAAAIIDFQQPETPHRVAPFEFSHTKVGRLTYRGLAEGWPLGGELMRWRMTYLTLEDDRTLTHEVTDHVFHHPTLREVSTEVAQAGLESERIGDEPFWLLTPTGQ